MTFTQHVKLLTHTIHNHKIIICSHKIRSLGLKALTLGVNILICGQKQPPCHNYLSGTTVFLWLCLAGDNLAGDLSLTDGCVCLCLRCGLHGKI